MGLVFLLYHATSKPQLVDMHLYSVALIPYCIVSEPPKAGPFRSRSRAVWLKPQLFTVYKACEANDENIVEPKVGIISKSPEPEFEMMKVAQKSIKHAQQVNCLTWITYDQEREEKHALDEPHFVRACFTCYVRQHATCRESLRASTLFFHDHTSADAEKLYIYFIN